MLAAQRGHVDVVRVLLGEEGVNVDLENYFGQTARDLASGNKDILQLFQDYEDILQISQLT